MRALPLLLSVSLFVGLPACAQRVPAPEAASQSQSARALASANAGVIEIQDPAPYSAIVALSDVHGMAQPLSRLLQAGHLADAAGHWVGGRTLLIMVGDAIDKGPQSIEVLDAMRALQAEAPSAGGRVIELLGNHEAEFLANPANSKATELLAELQLLHLPVTELTDPGTARGAFVHAMPLAARVGRWLFLHAGLYPDMTWSAFSARATSVLGARGYGDPFLAGSDSPLEAKDWWADSTTRASLVSRLSANGMFGVVQGHQPKAYGIQGRIGAIQDGHFIKIDCGLAPEAGGNPGQLLRFPQPSQLDATAFPQVEALSPDGTLTRLVPEASN